MLFALPASLPDGLVRVFYDESEQQRFRAEPSNDIERGGGEDGALFLHDTLGQVVRTDGDLAIDGSPFHDNVFHRRQQREDVSLRGETNGSKIWTKWASTCS